MTDHRSFEPARSWSLFSGPRWLVGLLAGWLARVKRSAAQLTTTTTTTTTRTAKSKAAAAAATQLLIGLQANA